MKKHDLKRRTVITAMKRPGIPIPKVRSSRTSTSSMGPVTSVACMAIKNKNAEGSLNTRIQEVLSMVDATIAIYMDTRKVNVCANMRIMAITIKEIFKCINNRQTMQNSMITIKHSMLKHLA